jgi:hypothetical protein
VKDAYNINADGGDLVQIITAVQHRWMLRTAAQFADDAVRASYQVQKAILI